MLKMMDAWNQGIAQAWEVPERAAVLVSTLSMSSIADMWSMPGSAHFVEQDHARRLRTAVEGAHLVRHIRRRDEVCALVDAPLGDSGVERRGEEAHHDVRLLDEGIESPTVLRIVRPIEKLMAKNKQQQQQQQQKEMLLERQDNIIRPRLDIQHSTLDTRL